MGQVQRVEIRGEVVAVILARNVVCQRLVDIAVPVAAWEVKLALLTDI